MPTITGTLSDIGLEPLSGLDPVLRFTPSSPAIGPGGRVFATHPVETTPNSSGAFTVDLASTDGLIPTGTHWRIQVLFHGQSSDGAGYTVSDFLPFELYVPASGGSISDLIGSYVPNDLVYVGTDVPNESKSLFMFQFHPVTGDLFERRQ